METITNLMGRVRPVPQGEHDAGRDYRMLSIVYSNQTNKSYISKQYVPTGINIDNKTYWQVFGNGKFVDNAIINVSYLEDSIIAHTLAEAISMVAKEDRRPGILLAFYEAVVEVNEPNRWNIYQFKGSSVDDWDKQKYWYQVYQNGSAFKGWFYNSTDLVHQYPAPHNGDFAYIGQTLEESIIWKCNVDGTWINSNEEVKKGIQVIISGNITVSSNNTWVVNGIDTGLPAKGDTGNTPLLRKNDSLEVIQISYDNGETYESLISYNTLKPIIEAVAVTGAEGTQAAVENIGTSVNPIFKFTIPQGRTGLQGPQGNTGANIDYPYELINNLETDDATKGLSAAQGVVLDQKIIDSDARISSEIAVADWNLKDYVIKSDGNFGTEASNKHACIEVAEGDIFFIKNSTAARQIFVAFATADSYSSGGVIPIVLGTSIMEATRDKYNKFIVPAGTSYLLFSYYPSVGGVTVKKLLICDDYINNADTYPIKNGQNIVTSGGVFQYGENIVNNLAGKTFISSEQKDGEGTFDGAVGETATFTESSNWRVSSLQVSPKDIIKVETTIYGSSHYGVVFVDSNEKIIANYYLRDSTSSFQLSVIIEVPADAAKVYVNKRTTTSSSYPIISKLIDERNVLTGDILHVLTTNCGSFHYGEESISLDTYKVNWRKMLNESEWDIWGVEDWAQYFDYGIDTIDAQDAIVADTKKGTFPLVKSTNDRTRVFFRGRECYLENNPDYTSSIIKLSTFVNGKRVYLYIIYWTSGQGNAAGRRTASQRIINEIALEGYDYAIIMGDFNAWTADEYDVWKTAGYRCANCNYLGVINTLRDIPADNIIVTPKIDIIKTRIIDDFSLNTDHKPTMAILKIN